MRPRVLPVPFLLSFLLLLAACGNDDTPPAAPPDTPSAEETETAAPAPAPTQSPSDNGQSALLGAYTGEPHTIADPTFEALPGATAHYGTLGDAGYRIEVPDDWNGGLVLYAHGFRGFGATLTVSNIPGALRQQLLDAGYAWAASSFSENGYAPGIGADDTLALRNHFAAEFGEPSHTYLVGVSMGGNVASLALEHHAHAYDGALALCGALGGQTQIDYLVSWTRLAEYFAEVELPLGPGANSAALTAFLLQTVSPALGAPLQPTAAGQGFVSAIRELTGGARPFYLEGLDEQFVANFALILADPRLETVLARAATNDDVEYAVDAGLGFDAAALNRDIVRQSADPSARDAASNPDKVPTTGRLSAPMLALHTTGDLFVPITHAVHYAEWTADEGTDDLFVARAIRASGHCTFSDAEIVAAFEDLVTWVEDGERPEGDDLSGDLTDIGHAFTNPIRPNDPGTP